ncbi:TKL/TKL-ccin protein kinase [Coprinopsis sp. MPI-PUGE-AT-0042]|nr:TKL/TKL-ccin protein kinase [Coprinopsis sp. MPI-PUGE-AT-0042]
MATAIALNGLDGLYVRLLSPHNDQSIELLHEDPSTWLKHHDADVASIIAEYNAVPLLQDPGTIEAVKRCLFPALKRTWILGAMGSTVEDANTDLRRLRDWQNELDSLRLLGGYHDVKTQLRRLLLPEFEVKLSHGGRQQITPDMFESVMQVDARHLAALVLSIITDDDKRENLVSLHDSDETKGLDQNLVDLLYALLGNSDLEGGHDAVLRALVRLSKAAAVFPRYLVHESAVVPPGFPCAEGSFGLVYKGRLDNHSVAVKILKGSVGSMSIAELVKNYSREAILWSQLHHENILPFYGVYFWRIDEDVRLGLLSPWMVNSNLLSYLHVNPAVEKLSLVLDIAQGLQYLHARKPAFIHGDLKSSQNNVLVTPSGTACLADFGLGRLAPDERWSTSTLIPGGALIFCAPELLPPYPEGSEGKHPEKTTKSDVYAFACLCYEIYYSSAESSKPLASQLDRVQQGLPCPKPASMEAELWGWLNRMWNVDPAQRPTMREFLDGMKDSGSQDRQQHTWNSVTTARLRSVSLIPSNHDKGRVGLAYPSRLEPIASSSTLVTVTTDNTLALNPGPPSSGGTPLDGSLPTYTSGQYPGSGFSSYDVPSHASALPAYRTQDWDSNHRPQWPDTQPSIITDVESNITFRSNDIIIALMGPSGTGKSTFINCAMRSTVALVGHGLRVCTEKLEIYGCVHPLDATRRVFFVDTPGMADSEKSDRKTLKKIAKWLKKTYSVNITLSGVLQFHRISDVRMGGENRANLEVFQEICGENALSNVIVVSTGWEETAAPHGYLREQDLLKNYLEDAMRAGCRYRRFLRREFDQAWDIIDLLRGEGRPLKIQTEMLGWRRLRWNQTSAFKALSRRFASFIRRP